MASNPAKRESLFPATSIGRSQGQRLTRTPSHESLTAHPLLSPNNSDLNIATIGQENVVSPAPSPKYVPYTPRQRPAAAAATVTVSSPSSSPATPSSSAPQPDATSKLQVMNMKAEAQTIGLDTGSIGWAMLEKLISETENWADWTEIWSALTSSKATILLPLEATSSALDKSKLTADFVKDHIVFYEGPSRKNAPVVTLTGLRGVLEDDTLTLRSSIHPSTKVFQDLLIPIARPAALSGLPPLPRARSDDPSFIISSHTTSLPLPPRPPLPNKPALPPRPNARPGLASASSRLSNPFASLFGGGHKPSSSITSINSAQLPTSSPTASPTASIHTLESDHPTIISAIAINRPIIFKDVGRDILRAIREDVKRSLSAIHARTWVIDRVHDFSSSLLYPLVKEPKGKGKSREEEKRTSSRVYTISAASTEDPIDEIADIIQDFYDALEQDLKSLNARKSGSGSSTGPGPVITGLDENSGTGDSTGNNTPLLSDFKTREIMNCVESTICEVFYDRLFMQPTSDDGSHDNALSSMIAALNQVDLTLSHLDLDVPKGMESKVDEVVLACGKKLSELNNAHSPLEKSSIVVAAHKVLVDGLSKLPPIKFKDKDSEKASTPTPAIPPESASGEREMSMLVPTIIEPHHADTSEPLGDIYPRSESPEEQLLTESTVVSGDILLPFLIFSVVKSNPPHLLSNLLFTQRFRNRNVGGEESYALINAMAVGEFLENVDMSNLGLVDSTQVVSAAALAPIPISRSPAMSERSFAAEIDGGLRGRMEQGVDAITGSANKVLTGVVDTSFGMLRSLLPSAGTSAILQPSEGQSSPRPGFSLLRRESGFSIAGISIGGASYGAQKVEEDDQEKELTNVSRPGSVRSRASLRKKSGDNENDDDEYSQESASDSSDQDDESEEDEEEGDGKFVVGSAPDTRSIRSFENMMSARRPKKKKVPRQSLGDRLATMSGLKAGPPLSPGSSRPVSPALEGFRSSIPPPNKRFVECNSAGDLKLSEVSQLLAEYKRLVESVKAAGGYDD